VARALAGRRVLVTGASGFVGGRLVERLVLECGADVRALVRTVGRAALLSRLPIEIVVGDVLDRAAVGRAAAGCDVVFHCARGIDGTSKERRAVDLDGTKNLIDASIDSGVGRFVHTSTIVVYDVPSSGSFDENAPPSRTRETYAAAKRAAERLVLDHASRLEVTVVQPTVVYGPRAGVYGRDIIEELRGTRIPLIDGGRGVCNALYVDDLVTAIQLAATGPRAPGERFLISGPEHPTWAEFFGAFERMLDVRHTVAMTQQEALAHWRRTRRRPWLVPEALRTIRGDTGLRDRLLATREGALLRSAAQRVLPASVLAPEKWVDGADRDEPATEPPLAAFKPDVIDFLASRAEVRIDKARELLGYRPVFGLADGMRLTEAWAQWEGLTD
jgi:nucleoside-diphosphate-sugar epimerase